MVCYLYDEGESQPALYPDAHATPIILARAVLFPILSSLHHRLTRLLKSDKLHCANVNLYLQLYNVEAANTGQKPESPTAGSMYERW